MSQSAAAAPAIFLGAAAPASVAARAFVLVFLLDRREDRERRGGGCTRLHGRLLPGEPLHHRLHESTSSGGSYLYLTVQVITRGASRAAARTVPSASRRSPGRRVSRSGRRGAWGSP